MTPMTLYWTIEKLVLKITLSIHYTDHIDDIKSKKRIEPQSVTFPIEPAPPASVIVNNPGVSCPTVAYVGQLSMGFMSYDGSGPWNEFPFAAESMPIARGKLLTRHYCGNQFYTVKLVDMIAYTTKVYHNQFVHLKLYSSVHNWHLTTICRNTQKHSHFCRRCHSSLIQLLHLTSKQHQNLKYSLANSLIAACEARDSHILKLANLPAENDLGVRPGPLL